MADSSDVEIALVALVQTAIDGQPAIRVFRGLPQPALLNADLAAGGVNIAVVATEVGQNTTRYLQTAAVVGRAAPGLVVRIDGERATFSGSATIGQVVGLVVDGVGWAYRVQPGDTPEACAAAIAALIPGASADGAAVSVSGLQTVRLVADQLVSQELMRQQRRFEVALFCSAAAQRDRLMAVLAPVLAETRFLDLNDATKARLRPAGIRLHDRAENAGLWRGDLLCDVEYLIVRHEWVPEMLFGSMIAELQHGVMLQFGDLVMPTTILTDTQGRVITDAAGHCLGDHP